MKNNRAKLLADADAPTKARLRSCAGPKASSWLNSAPKIELFRLGPADHVCCCLRLRLGLPQLPIRTDVKCKCGKHPDAHGVHYLTYSHGNHLQTRHELIVKAFHEMVQATSKHSQTKQLEQTLHGFTGPKGSALVLDQTMSDWTDDHRDIGLDYAICHPCATTYLSTSVDTDLGAADQRGGQKTRNVSTSLPAELMTSSLSLLSWRSLGR